MAQQPLLDEYTCQKERKKERNVERNGGRNAKKRTDFWASVRISAMIDD
jgi:hypothetical protein